MFERFKRNSVTNDGYDDGGTVATAERPVATDDPRYAGNDGATAQSPPARRCATSALASGRSTGA